MFLGMFFLIKYCVNSNSFPLSIKLSDKLLMRQTSDILRVVYDSEKYYPQNSLFVITSIDDKIV